MKQKINKKIKIILRAGLSDAFRSHRLKASDHTNSHKPLHKQILEKGKHKEPKY